MITLNISEYSDLATIQAEVLEWYKLNSNSRNTVNHLINLINSKSPGYVVIKREIGPNSVIEKCPLDSGTIWYASIVVDEYIAYSRVREQPISSFITVKNRYDDPNKMLTQMEFINLLKKLWSDINNPNNQSLYGGYGDA